MEALLEKMLCRAYRQSKAVQAESLLFHNSIPNDWDRKSLARDTIKFIRLVCSKVQK